MRKAALLLITLIVAVRASAQTRIVVQFGKTNATITGITPGGRAVLFGVGLKPVGEYTSTFRWAGSGEDTDHDGKVVIDIGQDIPGPTIWCAADAATAEFALLTSVGRPFSPLRLRPNAFRGAGNAVTQFAFDHSFVDLLYLEPGQGTWTCSESDGSKTDNDGPNGVTVLSIGRCKPIDPTGGPPSAFHPGGVAVAIDMFRLEAVAVRLTPSLLGDTP